MVSAALEWFWPVVSAASGALGAYTAIRTELRWLRADVNHAHSRIDDIEGKQGKRVRA